MVCLNVQLQNNQLIISQRNTSLVLSEFPPDTLKIMHLQIAFNNLE
jgi:hypothetical protein